MREVTTSGETVDEAVNSALQQLQASKDDVEIHIIDEGKKGFLGIFGSKLAIVSVKLKRNHIEETRKFLKKITEEMDIDVEIETIVNENHVTYHFTGDKIALLIGKRGQTLNALQYLTQLVLNRDTEQFYHTTLDAEGYRQRRKETLESLAERIADRAIRLNKKISLEPMPPFERKIIHSKLQNRNDVSTYSSGSEPYRYLVIKP